MRDCQYLKYIMDKDSFPSRFLKGLWKRFQRSRDSLLFFFGVLAVGALGFEAGFISGMSKSREPLRIELAPERAANVTTDEASQMISNQRIRERLGDGADLSQGACAFIASRNSKLFHASTCSVVKRIKPENKLCFKNAVEAEARGLKPGCLK